MFDDTDVAIERVRFLPLALVSEREWAVRCNTSFHNRWQNGFSLWWNWQTDKAVTSLAGKPRCKITGGSCVRVRVPSKRNVLVGLRTGRSLGSYPRNSRFDSGPHYWFSFSK